MDGQPDGVATEVDRLRTENERLRDELERSAAADDPATLTRRRRFIASVLLVVIGSTLVPVSVLTVWVRNQLLDTDRYVQTVAPLSDDPTVVAALSSRITERVSETLDIRSLAADALPEGAAFLAGPIASGADDLIGRATDRLLESDEFDRLWVEANRLAHDGLVAALTGRDGAVISTTDGTVSLQLGGLAASVLERVDEQFGLVLSERIPADRLDIEFVLVDSTQLADVQVAVRWLDRLSWASVLLALGALIGSVAFADDRRRALVRVGIGIAVSMLLLYVGFAVGRDVYLANLPDAVERPEVAAVVFDTLTRFVLQAVRVLFVVGLVVLTGAWLAGPGRAAATMRHAWDRLLGRGAVATGGAVDLGPVPAWFAQHLHLVRGVIVASAVVVLLVWERPTGRVVLLIAVVALVPLALAQVIAGADRRAGPSDDGDVVTTEDEVTSEG